MVQKMLLSEKIADTIMTGIKNGFYRVGYQMPNEMELSAELGVSRATLREAFKILISKNILEVRRGIGTFVSETPGFSSEGIGLQFLDLQAQRQEIVKLLKMLYEEEVTKFQHLPFDVQHHILSKLNDGGGLPGTMLDAILGAAESVALYRGASFKHRLMVVVHDAFVSVYKPGNILSDGHLTRAYLNFCAVLGNGSPFTYFEDFIMRLTHHDEEE